MLIATFLLQAAAACPATPLPLPADYAGWAAQVPVAAAAEPAAVGDAMLTVGRGAHASLQPAAALKLPVPPRRTGSHGGLFAFEAASAGRYRVALGAGVWVEVVANGVAVTSVAHGHGPACTAVRKVVDFDLKPGRYLLQLTGEPATVAMEILKVA